MDRHPGQTGAVIGHVTQTRLVTVLMALRIEDAIEGGTEEVKTTRQDSFWRVG
jgi:hypothetical protein